MADPLKEGIIPIEKVNLGGVADSKYSGKKHSVSKLVGWNLHETPGLMKVAQKLTKDSAAIIDQFCKVAVETSDGGIYWFSSESGKIWKQGSPYSLVHTTTPETGGAACLGAAEYGGYLYWFTEDRGHRIPIAGLSDWSTNAEEDVVELNLDQDYLGSTGDVYTNTTAVNEGATHRQSFSPVGRIIDSIAVHVTAKGTGNWTLKLHDSDNNELGTLTITNGNMSTGWVIFEFSSAVAVTKAASLHTHVYSSVADGTTTTSTNEDLEDGRFKIFRDSDTEFHPALKHFGILFIGDKWFIHQIEEASTVGSATGGLHSFTTEALDIE